ncbi:MAG: hypothetical protein J6R42_04445, partial [Clostridia bacterium]|nr:hypothetical protein [Clostridia bacterium]
DCTSLRGVVSANSYSAYDSIGERAFAGCTALEFIVFPTSLQTISADAFIGTPAIDIYYGGERMGDYNYYLGEDDPSLTGNVYLYSRHELEPEAYREGDDLYWHFDENGMPAQWLNFHDDVSGKTFTVTSAEAKLSEAYWNILVAAKQAGILNQVFAEDSDFYRAAMNSETWEEANAAFGEIYGNMFGEMVFSDGNVTVSNSTVTGATFAYHCINDVIFIHNTNGQFEKLYIKDGAIHELDSKPVEGYESCKIDVTFIYTVSE